MATKKGTNKSETLKGTDNEDLLVGLGGDDTLIGSDGNDRLEGGAGGDELMGGAGNDLLLPGLADGADAIDGGTGIDTVSYSNFSTTTGIDIVVSLKNQGSHDDTAGDTFFNVERFIGSSASDDFFIDIPQLKHYVFGGDGDDSIVLVGGVLRGGDGKDYLHGDGGVHKETFWLDLNHGADKIGNFLQDQDKIRISGKEFGIGSMLNSDEIVNRQSDFNAIGTKAQFIFRADVDELYFDADGTGSAAAVLVADFLDSSLVSFLDVNDFEIV